MAVKFFSILVAILALGSFVACGDDDDDDANGVATTATTEVEATATAPGDDQATATAESDGALTLEEYFATVDELEGQIDARFESDVFGAANAKEGLENLIAAIDEYLSEFETLEPPAEVADQHGRFIAAAESLREEMAALTESTSEDATPDELFGLLFAEGDPFGEVDAVSCELVDIAEQNQIPLEFLSCSAPQGPEAAGENPLAVEGIEYDFVLAGTVTAETTGIVFTNAGEEVHELILVKIPEDADIEALLAEDSPEGVEDLGATFAEPGNQSGLAFEEPLAPGRYVMLCFIPAPDGEPHYAKGMIEEFTVE